MKFKTYQDIENNYQNNIKQFQKDCKHKKSSWKETYWAVGHSTGHQMLVCDRCRKILEKKQTDIILTSSERFDKTYKKIKRGL